MSQACIPTTKHFSEFLFLVQTEEQQGSAEERIKELSSQIQEKDSEIRRVRENRPKIYNHLVIYKYAFVFSFIYCGDLDNAPQGYYSGAPPTLPWLKRTVVRLHKTYHCRP